MIYSAELSQNGDAQKIKLNIAADLFDNHDIAAGA